MSRLFTHKMQSPACSMARGPLLQLLLIQTQVYICKICRSIYIYMYYICIDRYR